MEPTHSSIREDLQAIRNQLDNLTSTVALIAGELASLRAEIRTAPKQQQHPFTLPSANLRLAEEAGEQLVTLDQMAAIVGAKKRSLERYKGSLPAPKIQGQRGLASKYEWAEVRPWLEQHFAKKLPENFPGFVA